jgi:type VI secretion system protein ImpA
MDSLAGRDFTFDTGKLVVPVSADSPSGESLRYDTIYDQIREARREDDPAQERGVWSISLKKADWVAVEKLCLQALEKRSKDLQIAAWLTEAWLQRHSIAGLREGLRVLNAICQEFWDTLYPLPEDGELEYRVAPFEWINEKLSVVIKLVAITNPQDDSSIYTLTDWETACRPNTGQPTTYRGKPVEPKITQEQFQESLAQTVAADLKFLLDSCDTATAALNQLTSTLDIKCGPQSPGLGRLTTTLNSIRGLMVTAFSQRLDVVHSKSEQAMETDEPFSSFEPGLQDSAQYSSGDPGDQVPQGSSGPIRSRAEAYRRLSEAADYLARTEPHSPVPYLVKRAIGWGSMNLQDLLPELVRNNSELSEIYRLLQFGTVHDE